MNKKISFLEIEGNCNNKDDLIEFIPKKISEKEDDSLNNYQLSLIRSNIFFKNGEIEFLVKIENAHDKVQVILGRNDDILTNIALNPENYSYAISAKKDGEFYILARCGVGNSAPIKEWLKVKINCYGSYIELFVNGVSVLKAQHEINPSQIDLLYRGKKKAFVKDFKVNSIKNKAFVVMQFSEEYNALYKEVIKPICEEFAYEVVRADDMYTTNIIINDITEAIKESSLVIADMTPNNPNVYYEIGYSHAIKKPTILLSDKNREKLPFDISSFRVLFYDNSIAGKSNVEESLRKHLEAIK